MKSLIIRILAIIAASVCFLWSAGAQESVHAASSIDSLDLRLPARIDSTLAGKSILRILPSRSKGDAATVTVNQSSALASALEKQISENSERTMTGYRVRIFNDNKRTSRQDSEKALKEFHLAYPDIPVYRTYTNPFFKVTVGDFRTKSEAMQLLRTLKTDYPTAFIVTETIEYPVTLDLTSAGYGSY